MLTNAVLVTVPSPITVGTIDPLMLYKIKQNQSLGSQIAVQDTDLAGNVSNCGPVLAPLNGGGNSG